MNYKKIIFSVFILFVLGFWYNRYQKQEQLRKNFNITVGYVTDCYYTIKGGSITCKYRKYGQKWSELARRTDSDDCASIKDRLVLVAENEEYSYIIASPKDYEYFGIPYDNGIIDTLKYLSYPHFPND
jgi:hypothetical protein